MRKGDVLILGNDKDTVSNQEANVEIVSDKLINSYTRLEELSRSVRRFLRYRRGVSTQAILHSLQPPRSRTGLKPTAEKPREGRKVDRTERVTCVLLGGLLTAL